MRKLPIPFLLLLVWALLQSSVAAEEGRLIEYKRALTFEARHCLRNILESGSWRYSPQFHQQMISVAVFAQVNLDGVGRKQYIYVMRNFGYCGTAGCSMLIGEMLKNGSCREIYSDAGSEVAVSVLPQQDHGYRRLLTPCEIRFDGREYLKVHDECPSPNVRR